MAKPKGRDSGDQVTERLRDLMDAAPVVAFVKDPEGRYVYANPYLLAIFGERMGSDWHGKTDADIWPAEVASMLRSNDQRVLGDTGLEVFSQVMPAAGGDHRLLMLKFPIGTGSDAGQPGRHRR